MMKLLTLAAPLLLKGPQKNPAKLLGGYVALGVLATLGALAVIIGLWFFLAGEFGVDIAWLSIGILLLAGAVAVYYTLLAPKAKAEPHPITPYDVRTDPLGELIPQQLLDDPMVNKILKQIDQHPVGAMAAAVAAGTVVGHEVFK